MIILISVSQSWLMIWSGVLEQGDVSKMQARGGLRTSIG